MSYVRRLVLGGLAFGAAALAATAASAEAPPARGKPELVGTYERVAKDMVRPDGSLRDVYEDRLVTGGKSYRLRLPQGTHLHGGTPVRVRGTLASLGSMDVEEVQPLGAPAAVTTTGTTKVLVILAYWTAPDSVTRAHARAQVFGDDHGWYAEASYGQLGLTGDATDWVQIQAPTGGHCYANHMEILTRAKAAAKAQYGYDAALYDRTMVYFPACGGDAAGAAGWAHVPGSAVWLNGYFDRRVSVHEQGHNYGLYHAHTLTCTSGGVRVTLGGSCYYTDYGDDYDAMGASGYAGHFSAPAKDQLGWLGGGRKREIASSAPTTFTLPPFEQVGAQPLAAVTGTSVATRKYWVEYRQAVGYDSDLPAGATGGVLVHMRDSATSGAGGAFLLDMSPEDYSFTTAVIPPSGSWTSPEGVRISVGAATAAGAEVTVEGGVGPPTVPSVPRTVVATGGDGAVALTWEPPTSNGGATLQSYVVTRTPGNVKTTVDAASTSAVIGSLTNGTEYAFTVAARNSVGTGTASAAVTAVPAAQLPSIALTAPAPGATIGGVTTLSADAAPHPVANAPIDGVRFEVDGEPVDWDDTAPYSVEWDSSLVADGQHTISATVYDADFKHGVSAPVTVTVKTPRPTVTVTAPADGATITDDLVTLEASAAPAPNGGAPVQSVTYELTDGTVIGWGSTEAPYTAQWDTTALSGGYDLVAKVTDADNRTGTSAPVHVTIDHPVPTVALTGPADGASVAGSVEVTATAAPSPVSQAPVDRVEFYVDGTTPVGTAWSAPYTVTWDTGSMSGPHVLTARAYDTEGHSATSAPRTVDVANPVPGAAITSPAEGAEVSGVVTFTATATPNAASKSPIDRVVFTLDGWTEVATVTAPPYTTTWNSSQQYGAHTLVATAYDEAGRSGASVPVAFTVASPAPTAVITTPGDGAVLRNGTDIDLELAAAPDVVTGTQVASAAFYVDGLFADYDDTPDDGFRGVWNVAPGQHVVTATVYDAAGFPGHAAAVTVTGADPPAAPTAVTAVAGANGTATVSWTPPADDGGGPVTGYVVRTGTLTKAATGSPFTFTGLTNGKAYAFSVAAANGTGTGTYSAASTPVTPGTRTTLSIAVTPATPTYGRSVTVTGTLKAGTVPVKAKTVQLLACLPGTSTCSVAKSGPTSDLGKVTLTYAPPAHRDLRLRFLLASPYLPATSVTKPVKVAASVSSAVSKATMALGGTTTVSGYVRPAHSGKRVYLQRLLSTGWKDVTYKNQGSTGYVAFAVKPAAKGTYTYRMRFPADADHLEGVSAGRTVKVT